MGLLRVHEVYSCAAREEENEELHEFPPGLRVLSVSRLFEHISGCPCGSSRYMAGWGGCFRLPQPTRTTNRWTPYHPGGVNSCTLNSISTRAFLSGQVFTHLGSPTLLSWMAVRPMLQGVRGFRAHPAWDPQDAQF